MFKSAYNYIKSASSHFYGAASHSQGVAGSAVKVVYSSTALGVQVMAGTALYEHAAGKICTSAAFSGAFSPITGFVGNAINTTVGIALKAICKHPTLSLFSSVALNVALYPQNLINTGKNLCDVISSSAKTLYEFAHGVKDVVQAVGSATYDLAEATYDVSQEAVHGFTEQYNSIYLTSTKIGLTLVGDLYHHQQHTSSSE